MNKHLRHIVYLSIWTFTVVVVWIAVLVFQQTSQTELSEEVLRAAEPIEPSFNTSSLDALEDRVQVQADLSSEPPQFTVIGDENEDEQNQNEPNLP